MNKKLCAKRADAKYWTYGSLKENPWGKLQVSIRNNDEFKKLVLEGGDWLNFSLFDDDRAEQQKPNVQPETYSSQLSLKTSAHTKAKADGFVNDMVDDEIPF